MKKLAIVGMARGSDKAPWKDRRYDCWGLNSGWMHVPTTGFPDHLPAQSVTAWFEIHSRRYLSQEWKGMGRTISYHERGLAYLKVPIYVQDPKAWPEVPKAVQFPRAKIVRAFPRGDYHAGSLDWMLAFALLKGYKDIHFWGVALGPTDAGEPLSARACLEYWIGYAEGRGVNVTVHDPTGMFWIYNYTREKTPYHYDDTWRLVEPR